MSYSGFYDASIKLSSCFKILAGNGTSIRSKEEYDMARRMLEIMVEFLYDNDIINDDLCCIDEKIEQILDRVTE